MWPILFEINGIKVKNYWVFMLLAYFLGGLVIYLLSRKETNRKELIFFILLISLGGFIGARLNYVLLNLDFYLPNPKEILLFYKGGFTSYGGIILGLITALIYLKYFLKKNNEEIKKWLDKGMLGFLFGHFIGRIGCFLNGCCYGKPSVFFLSLIFPALNDNTYRHPTQLYESFGYFLIYLFLLKKYFQKKEKTNGLTFAFGLFFHELIRFLVEFLRENSLYILKTKFLQLSAAQLVSLILMIISLFLFYIFKKTKIEKEESPQENEK